MFDKVAAIDDEDAHLANRELDPVERHLGQQFNQGTLALANLDNQHAILGQHLGRFTQYTQGQVEPVVAGCQTQLWLMCIFGRHGRVFVLGHIRRIADDEVVALAAHAFEQIRAYRTHSTADVLVLDVLAREGEGVVADIDQIDQPIRVVRGHGNADAAGTRAQVQRAKHLAVIQPRRESTEYQFGNRRTRHQCPPVGNELEAGKPGLAGKVRDWRAFLDASLDQGQHGELLLGDQPRLPVGRRQVMRQVQGLQDQMGSLVERVVVAVAESQSGRGEPAGSVTDEVDDRGEFGGH